MISYDRNICIQSSIVAGGRIDVCADENLMISGLSEAGE